MGGLDDVDLTRLVENVRYLAKRTTMDNELRERILICMNAFDNIINCDINLAYDLARDLTIIRALIKKESEVLDRKFDIFERKLRKVAATILPKEDEEEIDGKEMRPAVTTIFQDNDVRIIDTISKKSALNKMGDSHEMVSIVKEMIKLANSPDIPLSLRSDITARMNDILCLFKIDGAMGLKLKKDILDARSALKRGKEGEADLENKCRILKLKLDKCNDELEKKDAEYQASITQLDQLTEKALEHLDESVRGAGKQSRGKRVVRPAKTMDWSSNGTSSVPRVSPIQSPTMIPSQQPAQPTIPMPSIPGWILTPIDPSLWPGVVYPGTYGPLPLPGYYPIPNAQPVHSRTTGNKK